MAGKILGNFQQPELVAFLAHGNFFAGTHLVGRNVHLLTVDLHVTVADQLTGLAPRYGKAEAVDHDFGLAVFAVLAGSEITLLDRTLVREALCAFEEQFHALAAAKAAYCVFVSCQVPFSLSGRACPPLVSIGLRALGVPSSRSKISC